MRSSVLEKGRKKAAMEKYTLGAEIGRGAYASVFLVEENETHQKYVMKKISMKDLSAKDAKAAKQEVGPTGFRGGRWCRRHSWISSGPADP